MKRILLLVFSIFLIQNFYSQEEINYSLYRYNMNLINPAYAGSEGLNIISSYKTQWVPIENAPEILSLFYSQPIGGNMGIGLSIMNDKVFIENRTKINIDFSYKIEFYDSELFFGIKAGGSSYNINTDKLINSELSSDIVINDIDDSFRPNLGVGIYYKHSDYFIAISSSNLFSQSRIDNNGNLITQSTETPNFYAFGGYNFHINEDIKFRPTTLLRYYNRNSPLILDFTAALMFNDNLEIGLTYKTENALGGILMSKISDWFQFGYSYDYSFGQDIGNISYGSHEFMIRFVFDNER